MKKVSFSRVVISSIRTKCVDLYTKSSFLSLNGQFGRHPFQNPIALLMHRKPPEFTPEEKDVLRACDDSARVVIAAQHFSVLQRYFEEQAATDTVMGRFYRTMSFEDFLMRLIQKRYRTVFLDGRLVVPRENTDVLAKAIWKFRITHFFASNPFFRYRQILLAVGTEADHDKIYEEYLTLNELMLTPLLLPQVISIMIGTGSRDIDWPYIQEAKRSADLAVLTSAVAPEFSNGITLHSDFRCCVVIDDKSQAYSSYNQNIKHDQPLIHAAREIYGGKLAIDFSVEEAKQNQTGEFIHLQVMSQDMWLYKPAYFARIKTLLTTLLLSSDEAMQRADTGTVFNLKGMGLGAFGFSEFDNLIIMEKLYIEAVMEVLAEIGPNLQHIRVVNLINLPSDLNNRQTWNHIHDIAEVSGVQLTRSVMSPTEKSHHQGSAEVGATHLCADSASLVGNEAQIGAPRDSSDDPAGVYAQLNPAQLDPSANPRLQSTDCFSILDVTSNTLTPFNQSEFSQITHRHD